MGYPAGFFRCLPRQVGMQSGDCVLPSEVVTKGDGIAVLINGTAPRGVVLSSSTGKATSTKLSTKLISTAKPTATGTGTTLNSGSTSTSSSSKSSATGKSGAVTLTLESMAAILFCRC
ncbi:hypothetical protein BDZ45DRAFT_210805 [Acephala macrosclerotiorum]|nr:hypothetical protein BDZ45DRAFT_210805 [Acephala macrosclerotiorum]